MLHPVEVLANARRSVRRAVRLEADLYAACWDTPRRHRITDLSPDGLRVAAGTRLPDDAPVVVWLTLPGAGELELFARVVRSEPREGTRSASMGLELLDPGAMARARIARGLRGLPPPIPRAQKPRRELVWVDLLVTFTEDLGDRVNTFEVSEAMRAIDDAELAPAALSGLLTGGAKPYRWQHVA